MALPLIPVKVSSPEMGKTMETYALLDSESKISLCQDRLLKSLGATGLPKTMKLTTLEKVSSQCQVKVLSLTVTNLEGRGMVELPQVYSRTCIKRPAPQPKQPGLPSGSGAMTASTRPAATPCCRRGSHPPDRPGLP